MDEAEKHAQAVIPQNAPLLKMFLYGMIPESIRFALDLTLYPKYVQSSFSNQLSLSAWSKLTRMMTSTQFIFQRNG